MPISTIRMLEGFTFIESTKPTPAEREVIRGSLMMLIDIVKTQLYTT